MNRRLAAAAIAAALIVTACGSDDEPAADQPESGDVVDEPTDTTPDTTGDTDDDATAGAGIVVPGDPATGKPEIQLPDDEPTELIVTVLEEGDGDVIEAGDSITVDYVGVLTADGTQFDASYDYGQPATFAIGVGQVIDGWDQGLVGQREGSTIQLDIPSDLAYGDDGYADVIPGGAALTFVIEIHEPAPPPTLAPQADAADCPAVDGSSDQQQQFDEYPPTCIDTSKTYTAEIVTNKGTLVVELDDEAAPLTVNNFVTLARYHYFDDTNCHRIIPGFMAQCGDPTATGTGDPGYSFADELPASSDVYTAGTVAMANSGPDTNGSQFFIITGDATFLPPSYSVFGRVIEGMDDTLPALDAAGNPDDNGVPPLEEVVIESVTITER
ncbi:MAG: peptidylprolyl isomerase [Ilumatobacteraceae bacterium]